MKPVKQQLILILAVVCLLSLCHSVFAEEYPIKEARLTMGFYLNSISEMANRSDIEVSLNFWGKELFELEVKKRNFTITSTKSILFDRIGDMQKAFENGELDMIVAPPLLISRHFKRKDLGDGFVGVLEGKKRESLLLLARTDKNISRIKDLRGKRVGMIEDELADVFFDILMLTELRKSYKSVGLAIQIQQKSSRIILDIFFDKADAGMVYSSAYDVMAELNPDITNKIKILAQYPMKGRNFSYFRHDYPLIEEFTQVAMSFRESPRTQQILETFKTPEVDYCKVEELDSFDKLYKDYLQLKKHAKK